MKDYFSLGADQYKKFRPVFSIEYLRDIISLVPSRQKALDCGTGNGQIAIQLAPYFLNVDAIDISQEQLDQASEIGGIQYSRQPAEKTNFPNGYFDLLISGQAAHWFDLPLFFKEANRILKPNGILALIGYNLLRIHPAIDRIVDHFYHNVVGPYWDHERKHVDNEYLSLPFPYQLISLPTKDIICSWKLSDLLGYLSTWSALKIFIENNGYNPLSKTKIKLENAWGHHQELQVHFPVFQKIGRKPLT